MFAKILGRRATAVATTLAVVVGLAITPAFTAAAADGDAPVVIEQTTEVVTETELPPVEQPASDIAPPAEELPAEQLPAEQPPTEEPPVDESDAGSEPDAGDEPSAGIVDPPAPQSQMRTTAPMVANSVMGTLAAGIMPAVIPTQVMGQPVDIQFSTGVDHDKWEGAYLYSLWSDLEVSESGQLSGSFSHPGSHTLRVKALKHVYHPRVFIFPAYWTWDTVDTKTYTFNVIPAVTTTALPDATVGVAYNQTLDATRGSLTNFFSVVEGALPPRLSLNRLTGKITGTVRSIPASPTTYNFSVVLTANGVDSTPKPLSITVGYAAPTVTTTTVADATVGSVYPGAQLTASGAGTITWSVTGLPAGLTLDAVTGAIAGTPSYDASYGASKTLSFTVTANNGRDSAPKALSITVLTPLPEFGPKVLPGATIGVAYSQALPVTGGYGVLSYTKTGGNLPTGLTLNSDGTVTGTPVYDPTVGANKTYTFRATVTSTAGTVDQQFKIAVTVPAPTVDTDSLDDGWLTQPYNQPIVTTGPGVVVTLTGTLPTGLSLVTDQLGGYSIQGTPRSSGVAHITINAENTAGLVSSQILPLEVHGAPQILTRNLPKSETGVAYAKWIDYDGQDVTFSLARSAPAGVAITLDGKLKWNLGTAGIYTVKVKATNLSGTDIRTYTIKVLDAPSIMTTGLDQGITNMPFKQKLQHEGTNVKFTIVNGYLPDGLTLTKKGVIKGVATEAGTFTFKVRAKNAIGVDRQWFTLTVTQPAATLSSTSITRGGTITITGTGFLPGDSQEIWLHSTPVLLGTVLAAGGSFTTTVVIPAGTEAGLHHIEVRGAQSGSQFTPLTISNPVVPATSTPRSTAPRVTIVETPVVPDASAEVAESTPEKTSTPENTTSELPTLNEPKDEAGSETSQQNWVGLAAGAFALLLAALLILFLLWRRRRQAEEN